jgi:hypothetical protein
MKPFEGLAFRPADILIPKSGFEKWSVVACDQHTSEPEYWENTRDIVGDAPSTLRLVLPEAWLGGEEDNARRVAAINARMRSALSGGLLRELPGALILVERTLTTGRTRRGLVGAIDLEKYDYAAGSESLIRPTEGTVLERIPPRVRIRRGAPLEIPHIMMLIDDPDDTVIGPAARRAESLEKLYDFELMQGGGRIRGFLADGTAAEEAAAALRNIESEEHFAEMYGKGRGPVMAYAVGDGNHSLASAKRCWELIKAELTPAEALTHPARYALVELVNLHDESLGFAPIHRVVFGVDPEKLLGELFRYYPQASVGTGDPGAGYAYAGGSGSFCFGREGLPAGLIGEFLDDYTARRGGSVDYIHGEDVARRLGMGSGAVAFLLPAMRKDELFSAVLRDGSLPRKTFSMGRAQDKRYYLEARKITRL